MNITGFMDSLQIMGFGMVGIFIVFAIIYGLILLFNKLFPDKQ